MSGEKMNWKIKGGKFSRKDLGNGGDLFIRAGLQGAVQQWRLDRKSDEPACHGGKR